jgi:hypothetical protein
MFGRPSINYIPAQRPACPPKGCRWAAGRVWLEKETADGDAVVIGTPGMVEIGGVPMLAYVDLANNDFVLKFAALY